MSLIRKIRTSGRRIIITLPCQIGNASYIKNRDFCAITPLQQPEILMKKTEAELVR